MRVKDLLESKKPPVTIKYTKTIQDCMRLLIDNKIGSVIIVDDEKRPIGIITERDIFHLAFRYRGDMMDMIVKDNMTSKLIIGHPDDKIDDIADLITVNKIRHVPIMEDQKLVGIVSIRDVVKARAEQLV
ncbi:MAG: CBS domain-containing protein [candidate division Zixibacteria bacterium]|nr:CBS domain-containing protein [candidate division Zixibacteria bacterium]